MKNKIFLAAAHTHGAPLPQLVEEIRNIENILRPLEERGLFELESNRAANIDDIFNTFTESSDIQVFHYAGHAEGDKLYLEEDGDIKGITELFGLNKMEDNQWNKLQFVFINGCSSKGQVASFHNAGVGAIIATSRPIGDEAAKILSKQFYETWSQEGKTIKEAFEVAKARVHSNPDHSTRSIEILDDNQSEGNYEEEIPWGLYFHPDLEDQEGEQWVLNKKPSLPAMVLSNIRPNPTQSLRMLVKEFRDTDEDAKTEIRNKRRDPLMVLIERLPWIMSTHLRRLFAVESERTISQPGRVRLKELIVAYTELTRFVSYVSLSILWDFKGEASEEPFAFSLIPSEEDYKATNFIFKAKAYMERLVKINNPNLDASGLVSKISNFLKEVDDEAGLQGAYQIMEEWKQALSEGPERFEALMQSRANGDAEEEKKLVLEAEMIYARFLKSTLFFTQYRLHTVRAITVDKLRSIASDTPYSHRTISLHAAFSQLETQLTEREAATDNYCLLLTPRNQQGDVLANAINLSPFYLDRSSFIGGNISNYPALFALDFKRDDVYDEEYIFHYIDKDINHEYAFAKDLELKINSYGAELPEHLEVKNEEMERFEKIYEQLNQLNQDIPQNA